MINLKKCFLFGCAYICLLSGCNHEDTYLKPYSVVTANKGVTVGNMLNKDVFEGFAQDLGVLSIADNQTGYHSELLDNVDAKEIFLAGTTNREIIAAKNIYEQMPPASLTKILTALTAYKHGGDLNREVTLTSDVKIDIIDAQVCGFMAGDVIKLKDLIEVMLVYSGNDAANAVAASVSGSIGEFCNLMNEEAHALGATQTNFVTANGLDNPSHYTTAYDLYLIFNECLKYEEFKTAISKSSSEVSYKRNGETVNGSWPTTNYYLLGKKNPPEGIHMFGGKTGTTDNAGLCLILYVEDKNQNGYISLLLGSPDKDVLYNSMTNLLSNICK